ncbi:hypothetical protein [Bacillus wiedmannii]|uniref:hypothetical protein n=1 Tax=Bacillus wiedmannii TaxID=1890302 RepID=UPI000BEFBB94|nr:hypothetical protein [Bacillus wiedmannii]PEM30172.1 hypothetical protein CN598_12670 [Bacillus wiedmannii]
MEIKCKTYQEKVSLMISEEKYVALIAEPQIGCSNVDMTPDEARRVAKEIIKLADTIEEVN